MYIFGYKTTVFIQNLYLLVKFFGKNFIVRVKSINFLVFLGLNVHFWVQNYSFYPNLYFLVKYFGKNFIFSVKSTNILFFQDQMYIFGYRTTVFIQNLYILVKLFGKNFIFSIQSTIFFVFLGPNVHFWVQKYSFYLKFVHFSEIVWPKLHF